MEEIYYSTIVPNASPAPGNVGGAGKRYVSPTVFSVGGTRGHPSPSMPEDAKTAAFLHTFLRYPGILPGSSIREKYELL